MSVRPYLLPGDSDRRFLAERLAAAFAAWRGDWLADGAPEPGLSPEVEPRARRWLALRSGAAVHLLLGCRDGWLAQLGALATAQPLQSFEPGPSLAAALGEAMLEAAALQVFGALSAAPAPSLRWDAEGPTRDWFGPGAGGAVYDLWPLLPALVALSPQLVAAALPKARALNPEREPLAPRFAGLEASTVALEAVVGAADLELGELARLAAGDVVVLERRLDEPLELQLGTRPVARVHLGMAAGGKAVQVVARANQQ